MFSPEPFEDVGASGLYTRVSSDRLRSRLSKTRHISQPLRTLLNAIHDSLSQTLTMRCTGLASRRARRGANRYAYQRTVKPSLSLEHIWEDDSMIELRVSTTDSHFSGVTQIYTSWESLNEFANRLRGFPCTTLDIVEDTNGQNRWVLFFREYVLGVLMVPGMQPLRLKWNKTKRSPDLLIFAQALSWGFLLK